MLFGTEFDESVIGDEDKLVEKLYEFLRAYVNKRLIFESDSSREDYVQDTIMYILDRYNGLTEEEKHNINLEKYFYNRANSFIGNKQRTNKRKFKLMQKYLHEKVYLEDQLETEKEIVDERLLFQIVSSYKLKKEQSEVLRDMSRNKLVKLGYIGSFKEINSESLRGLYLGDNIIEYENKDSYNTLEYLSYSVVDEYLTRTVRKDYQEVEAH